MDGLKFHTGDGSYTVHIVLSLPYSLVTELNGSLLYASREENWIPVGSLTPETCAEHFSRAIMEKKMLTGSILMWFGQELPSWGLLCDGSIYSRYDYPALWETIVDHHKTPSQFVVPDLRNMFVKGVETAGDTGEILGNYNNEVVLQEQNLPAHSHVTDSMSGIVNGGALASLPVMVPGVGETNKTGSGSPVDITPYHMGVRMVIVL